MHDSTHWNSKVFAKKDFAVLLRSLAPVVDFSALIGIQCYVFSEFSLFQRHSRFVRVNRAVQVVGSL